MHFEIVPSGSFSLKESAAFLGGWPPAGERGTRWSGHLHLAFVPEGELDAAGVCLQQRDDSVVGEVFGETVAIEAVRAQAAQILSLDVDGAGFAAVGHRDAVVAGLQARYPGFRPVNFLSPYEAAVWALISQRTRMTQASALKRRMACELGAGARVQR